MAMGGVDHDQVNLGLDERFRAGKAAVADCRCRRNAQPPGRVLGRIGIGHGLFNVLDRDEPRAPIGVVDDQQFLDPPRMEQPPRFFRTHARAHRRQIVARHQFRHRLMRVFGKADIAVRDDADQPTIRLHHWNPADLVPRHQPLRLRQRCVGGNGDGVDHHPAFKALDVAHRRHLLFNRQIAVEHTNAAKLRHHDRHIGLGHRVHRRRQHRNVKRDAARQPRARIGHRRHNIAFRRAKQHIVKGKAEADVHELPVPASQGSCGGPCNQAGGAALGPRAFRYAAPRAVL